MEPSGQQLVQSVLYVRTLELPSEGVCVSEQYVFLMLREQRVCAQGSSGRCVLPAAVSRLTGTRMGAAGPSLWCTVRGTVLGGQCRQTFWKQFSKMFQGFYNTEFIRCGRFPNLF